MGSGPDATCREGPAAVAAGPWGGGMGGRVTQPTFTSMRLAFLLSLFGTCT
jgi:hypothetical protein